MTVRELAALLQDMVNRGHGDAVTVTVATGRPALVHGVKFEPGAGNDWTAAGDRVVIE